MAAKVSLQRHLFSSYVIAPSFPLDGRTRDTMNDQRMCMVVSSSGSFVKFRSYSKNKINLDVALGLTVYLASRQRKIFSFLPAS